MRPLAHDQTARAWRVAIVSAAAVLAAPAAHANPLTSRIAEEGPGGAPAPEAEDVALEACRFTFYVAGGPGEDDWAVYRDGAPEALAVRAARRDAEALALEIALDLGRARVVYCGYERDAGWTPETDSAYGCALPQAQPSCPGAGESEPGESELGESAG